MELIKPSYEIISFPNNCSKFLELCGRVCYKSEDRITECSADKFCSMIAKNQHLSVLEHASATVRFIVNRGFTHELVRHRIASFSQESTRYCNYNKKGIRFIIPPWTQDIIPSYLNDTNDIKQNLSIQSKIWLEAMLNAEAAYKRLIDLGRKPQEARGVLPIDLKTEIIMTANIREWMHVFKMRASKKAHPQMQEIMYPLLQEFSTKLNLFNGAEE